MTILLQIKLIMHNLEWEYGFDDYFKRKDRKNSKMITNKTILPIIN
jgi:hypothetical protein